MEANFLRLKQAILSNNVADFDALSSKLAEASEKDGSTPLLLRQADTAGYTLLHWAAHVMKPQFILKCLDFGVPLECQDRLGKTALHRALERSQTDPEPLMEAFLSYLTPAIIASPDRMGRTALHIACMKGYDKTAAILIESCMRREEIVALDTSTGSTDSRLSPELSPRPRLSTQISDDSIVFARDYAGWTALHFASFYNRMNVVKLLISTLPAPNSGPSDASTSPRHSSPPARASSPMGRSSTRSGSPPATRSYMAQNGSSSSGSSHPVSSNASQRSGHTNQSSVKTGGSAQPSSAAATAASMVVLPRRFPSVDVNAASNDGWTPLHAAAAQGHLDILTELLVKGGGDPNRAALHGQTPLHVACLNSHITCAKLLREHDADPKILDKAGLSCFACASKEIRLALRKTTATVATSPLHTSIVGMPHNPTAEREVKFAIQARDKWGRRRTHGGDYFDVVVSREVPVPVDDDPTLASTIAAQMSPPTVTSTSTVTTPTATVQITRHIQVGLGSKTPEKIPFTLDSGSTEMDDLSARSDLPVIGDLNSPVRGSNDYIISATLSTPNGTQHALVHNVDSPRTLLKASQVSSTPLLPSKSKTQWAESRIGDGLNTIADEEEDFVIPRARSDVPISRSVSQVPNASSLRVVTTFTPAKITTAIKDLESGIYILRWRPMQEGTYHVSIKLRGVEIQGSPFLVVIAPPSHRAQHSASRRTASSGAPTASSTAATTGNTAIPTYYEYPDGAAPPSSSIEEPTPLRSPSTPIDLISGMRPDLTPKPLIKEPTGKDSPKEKDKKDKRDKKSHKSTSNTGSTLGSSTGERDRSTTIGSHSPTSVSPSSTSALSNSGVSSSLAFSEQSHSRKRSSSATSTKSNDPNSARGRSGSEVRNTNQISSDPGRNSRPPNPYNIAQPLPVPTYATLAEEDLPNSASSTTSSRSLYRMTSTFSPMKSISNELTRTNSDANAASKEIADLSSQVADLNKQLSIYATRIQELETEQILADRRLEEAQAEDKKTIANLSAALQAEQALRLCQGCQSTLRNAVAVPCLHMSHCNNCIETMSTCPSCGGPLKGFITVMASTK